MVVIINSSITLPVLYGRMLFGLRLFKMDTLADNLPSVIDYFGGSISFDRAERWTILQDWENEESCSISSIKR